MTDDPGNCVICGAPIVRASNRRSGKKAITCTDPECRAERNRRYVRARYHRMTPAAPSRPRRSKPVFGGRAGVLHGKALAAAVEADRPGHGELAGVDWSPGDCPRRRGDDGPCIHVACIHHTCAEIDPRDGGVWVDPRFTADPYSVVAEINGRTIGATCVLDLVRECGNMTLEAAGRVFGVCRERIRQIEADALDRLRRRSPAALEELQGLAAMRQVPTGLAELQGGTPQAIGSTHRGDGSVERGLGESLPREQQKPGMVGRKGAPRRLPTLLPPSLAGHAEELR